ncbi:MAG: aldolase [Alphaproteobacteria bacterium]|jgi:staphyloferrin B biosynthesis citrate synthase|nr:aldolase [Alphaproteobacteria bacterium]MBU1552949.1 aldolase [Alphaproteobacteria bacterium]MBU2338291.1 aldolase [Alphaproteobacteria bacterium]MBU2388270.1 aldolase [Alphaproteobacteria bacterium]
MTQQRPHFSSFRDRLRTQEPMLGTFLKLATTQVIEILGAIGYDFVVIDQEHAPLDRSTTDMMIFAARASNVAPIVRVGDSSDANILSALDCGASGIMVPHVATIERAEAIARACRYRGGNRGFAGLTRASGWGLVGSVQHMAMQDNGVTCIAMIEEAEAVDRADDIARIDGIDALFVGRGDMTASFGDDPGAGAKVAELTAKVAAAARDTGVPLMLLASGKADLAFARDLGARAILVSSDHGFIRSAATAALADYRG